MMDPHARAENSASAYEIVAEALAVGGNAADCGAGEMDWQDERVGVGDFAEEAAARLGRLLLVGIEDGRPVGLTALQRVVHHVAGHYGMLALGADVDAAVVRRMAGCWRKRKCVVECKGIVHQQRLTGINDWSAIVGPHVARWISALLGHLLPVSVLALVEDVL